MYSPDFFSIVKYRVVLVTILPLEEVDETLEETSKVGLGFIISSIVL